MRLANNEDDKGGNGPAFFTGTLSAIGGANLSWLVSRAMFIGNSRGHTDFDSSLDATLLLILCYPTGLVIGFLAGFSMVSLAKRSIYQKLRLFLMVSNIGLSLSCVFIFCVFQDGNTSWKQNPFLFQISASFFLLIVALFFLSRARRTRV